MIEYMIQIWGGAWNNDANPSIRKDLGIEPGTYYFKTNEERKEFIKKISPYKKLGMRVLLKEGIMSHKDTVADIEFSYKGKIYPVEYNFGKEYDCDSAEFIFFDGYYSCDCNRSLLIKRQCDKNFPELDSGNEIKIKKFQIKFV